MGRRLELQTLLEQILGSPEVHFQAPSNKNMKYPSIVYSLDSERVRHADNAPYSKKDRYQVTYIYKNPDDDTWRKITDLPHSSFERSFIADNLYHVVVNLYF
jgi:hypothetical protein